MPSENEAHLTVNRESLGVSDSPLTVKCAIVLGTNAPQDNIGECNLPSLCYIPKNSFTSLLLWTIKLNSSKTEFNPFSYVTASSKRRIHPVTQQLPLSSIKEEEDSPVPATPEFSPQANLPSHLRAVTMAVSKHSLPWYYRATIRNRLLSIAEGGNGFQNRRFYHWHCFVHEADVVNFVSQPVFVCRDSLNPSKSLYLEEMLPELPAVFQRPLWCR